MTYEAMTMTTPSPATLQMNQMSYQINSLYFTSAHTAPYQPTSYRTTNYVYNNNNNNNNNYDDIYSAVIVAELL